jgi:hypothetical protein
MTESRTALLLFAAALLVRVVAWSGMALFGTDGGHYLLMADWFAAGRFHDALQIAYHPLYPLLIAVARIPLGDTIAAGHLVSVVLGAAAIVPLHRLIRRAFGAPEAFVGALVIAFNPSFVGVSADVLTEGSFLFFFLMSIDLAWQVAESPSVERGATLGLCAAAAYLTRPEGILAVAVAVAWPLAEALRRRDRAAARAGALLLTVAVIVIAAAPYLLWIKSVKGGWSLSMRPSIASVTKAATLFSEGGDASSANLYATFAKGIYRLTYLVTIPFYLVGLRKAGRAGLRAGLFFFGVPLAYMAGLLFTLRGHNFMTERYLMAPMAMLSVLPALGITTAFGWAARRWPGAAWRPAACAALLLAVAVLPFVRWLGPTRLETRSFPEAALWIRTRTPAPRGVYGPPQQIAYLAGCPSRYSATTPEDLRKQIAEEPVDYYVYTERDLAKRPAYIAALRSCDRLEPPVEIAGPPGSLRVYVQRVK